MCLTPGKPTGGVELARAHGFGSCDPTWPAGSPRPVAAIAPSSTRTGQICALPTPHRGAQPVDHDLVDAIGAGADESDLSRPRRQRRRRRRRTRGRDCTPARAAGQERITLIRAVLLADGPARPPESGSRAGQQRRCRHGVIEAKSLFWKDKDAIGPLARPLAAELIAKAVSRLIEAERQVMSPGGPGIVAADAELFAICRQAARLR